MANQTRRQLIKVISNIVVASFAAPFLLSPSKTSAGELSNFAGSYKPYKQASDDEIRDIIKENNGSLKVLDVIYPIAPNNVLLGEVTGEFAISRDYDYTRIQMNGDHFLDGRSIELEETFNGQEIIYYEKGFNKKGKKLYNNSKIMSLENRVHTPISLANKIIDGNAQDLNGASFIFKGQAQDYEKYFIRLIKTHDPLCLEAEILYEKKDSNEEDKFPLTSKLGVEYRIVDGYKFPVEAYLVHGIKDPLFGKVVNFPFRGVLRSRKAVRNLRKK